MLSSANRFAMFAILLGLCVAGAEGGDNKAPEPPALDLKVGDKAPTFQGRTDAGATWSSSDVVGKKWLVVYFYPGDFTPGCTSQARAFRETMARLREKGVDVVGVSGDSVQTHELFKKAQKLNFTLLADEDGAIAKSFGVPIGPGATVKTKDADGMPIELKRALTAARWTFVIGKDGKVAFKNAKVVAAEGAKEISEFIEMADKK